MSEMTLPSRHRIRNSNPGAEHAISRSQRLPSIRVDGEEVFLFLSNRRDREPNLKL